MEDTPKANIPAVVGVGSATHVPEPEEKVPDGNVTQSDTKVGDELRHYIDVTEPHTGMEVHTSVMDGQVDKVWRPPVMPSVAAPSVAAPSVATPSAALPTVAAPSVAVSPAATPSVAAPSVAAPSVAAPSVATPSAALPTVAAPSVAVPPAATPSVAAPSVATPSVAAPSVATPTVAASSVAASSVAAPPAATPPAATPCVDTSSVATPSFATPSSATPSSATPSSATPSSATPSSATPSIATPSVNTPTETDVPLRKPPKKRSRRALNFLVDDLLARPDSGSESDDIDLNEETEWASGAGPANMRLVSRKLREHEVFREERQLVASAYAPERSTGVELLTTDGVHGMGQAEGQPARSLEAEEQRGTPEADGSSPACSNTFTWSDDFSTFSGQREVYLNTPGSRVTERDPVGLFQVVWDKHIIAHIVKETNDYAWQTICLLSETDGITTNLEDWEETTVEEIYRLFAILNYMSIDYRARIDEYWTTGVLGMPQFREIMTRNRFSLLMRFLHFVNNDALYARSYDRKISKIAPVVEHCNRKFCSMYTPQQSLSLDESLLLWKGRLAWVQRIRTKTARFGIKSFELCEAESGYMLRCLLYAGKNSSMTEGPINGFENATAKVVLELMDGYLDVGHMLVMDNWYNQLSLTRYLKQRRTDVIGTINRRRINVPPAIRTANESRMSRGDQIAFHCGDITMIAWNDVKLVTAISTCHNAEQVGVRRAGVRKPALIDAYNHTMGGVDLKDQKLSMFMLERKRGNKWYIKVFRRLLNTSFLNTFIIYTKHAQRRLTHRDFRYRVSEGLLAAYQPVRVPRPKPAAERVSRPTRLIRDAQHDHFPMVTASTSQNKSHHQRRRCACCTQRGKRASTTTVCRTCDVPLCVTCWVDYHTKPKL